MEGDRHDGYVVDAFEANEGRGDTDGDAVEVAVDFVVDFDEAGFFVFTDVEAENCHRHVGA